MFVYHLVIKNSILTLTLRHANHVLQIVWNALDPMITNVQVVL